MAFVVLSPEMAALTPTTPENRRKINKLAKLDRAKYLQGAIRLRVQLMFTEEIDAQARNEVGRRLNLIERQFIDACGVSAHANSCRAIKLCHSTISRLR
jgi:hypothetical protein